MFNPLSYKQLPSVEEIKSHRALPPISPWVVGGGWFIVSVLAIATGLTTVISYKTVVRVHMTVRPQGEIRLVQTPTEGSIVSIEAKNNQSVLKGQTIAILDSSKLRTRQAQVEESITEAQNQIAQIDAQTALLNDQIDTEKNRVAAAVAIAQAELADSQRSYRDRQIITSTETREAQAALRLAEEELASYQSLVRQGAAAQLEVVQKQAAVEVANARLEQTTAALNPTNSDVTAAEEKIAQVQSQGAVAMSQLMQTQSQLLQQRSELQETLNSGTQELEQLATDLKGTEIKAPTSGTIQSLSLRNVDQVVQPGETIAKIFPDAAELEVQALVPSNEISKVEAGQTVKMRISACPFSQFGTLPGTVITISPDTLPVSEGDSSGQASSAFYAVTIQPQRSALVSGGKECLIQSGIEGRADIIARRETVLDFILRKVNLTINT